MKIILLLYENNSALNLIMQRKQSIYFIQLYFQDVFRCYFYVKVEAQWNKMY